MLHDDITEKIIGCALRVYNTLGYGFLESVYRNSLKIEMEKAGLDARMEHPMTVYFHGHEVGKFSSDFIVNDTIIVELKSIERLMKTHHVQIVNYLSATRKPVGLLINFGPDRLEFKRKVRVLARSDAIQ